MTDADLQPPLPHTLLRDARSIASLLLVENDCEQACIQVTALMKAVKDARLAHPREYLKRLEALHHVLTGDEIDTADLDSAVRSVLNLFVCGARPRERITITIETSHPDFNTNTSNAVAHVLERMARTIRENGYPGAVLTPNGAHCGEIKVEKFQNAD